MVVAYFSIVTPRIVPFWVPLLWCLMITACPGQDVELLSPEAAQDDASVDSARPNFSHRPAPLDAGTPEEPPDLPAPTEDAGSTLAAEDAGTEVPPMPTTPTWIKEPPYPAPRGAMGAATFGQRIYIMGGDLDYEGKTPSTAHRVFDTGNGAYTSLANTPDNHQWGPCATVYGKYLYLFGGWSAGAGVLRRYDFELDRWQYLTPSPAKQMWGFACALVNGVIYVVSGATNDTGDRPTNKVSAYNIATNSWSQKANYPASKIDLAGAAIGARIYVLGRGDALDVYDTTTNTWSKGPSIGRDAARSAVVAHEGLLYVFGGTSSNKANRFDPRSQVWSELPAMSKIRGNAAAAVVGDEIHVIGGFTTPKVATDLHEALLIPSLK